MSVRGKVIQKLRNMMIADTTILQYVKTVNRIYAAHLSTVQDRVLPAISIQLQTGPGRDTNGPWMDNIYLQIEPWFQSIGSNTYTTDDLAAIHEAILGVLHRAQGNDLTIGIVILEITNVQEPIAITDPDGILHYPSLWKIKATA